MEMEMEMEMFRWGSLLAGACAAGAGAGACHLVTFFLFTRAAANSFYYGHAAPNHHVHST